MKKILFGILLLPALCFGEGPRPGEVSRTVRAPTEHVSQAVFQSSLTCAGSTLQSVYISSPFAASLYLISVSSAGQGGAYFEVWDGQASTGSNTVPRNRLVDYVNSTVSRDYMYNVSFSSWLAVSNQPGPTGAGTPACLKIIYRLR